MNVVSPNYTCVQSYKFINLYLYYDILKILTILNEICPKNLFYYRIIIFCMSTVLICTVELVKNKYLYCLKACKILTAQNSITPERN